MDQERPRQVPRPTCSWKWHSWQLGNLTKKDQDSTDQLSKGSWDDGKLGCGTNSWRGHRVQPPWPLLSWFPLAHFVLVNLNIFLPSWAKLIAQLKWFIKFMDNSYCNYLDISMNLKVNGLVLCFYLKMRKYDQKLRGKFPLIPHDRRHVYSAKRKLEGEGWEGKASKEDQLVWSLLTPYLSY